MKKKRTRSVKARAQEISPLDSIPLPKPDYREFWVRFALLKKMASDGDEHALQQVFLLAAESLSHLVEVWRTNKSKRALNQLVFAVKDALDSLAADTLNPSPELLELAQASHVWPVLLNPHPDEFERARETVRSVLKVGAATGFNYYGGRKKFGLSPKKRIAVELWDRIDSFRCNALGTASSCVPSWRTRAAVNLGRSTRQKASLTAWWKVARALLRKTYGKEFEKHPVIRAAFADEERNIRAAGSRGRSAYKNKEGRKLQGELRHRIEASLRQEFRTLLAVK